jgi:hypothetical protein
MDIGRSFSYIIEDQDWWKKVLIGGLLTLIPIVGPFYGLGYMMVALKNVIDGRELPLPEALEDFGGMIVKGLLISVIVFIYMLPLIIVASCAGGGSAVLTDSLDSDIAEPVGIGWAVCFGCLASIYGIVMGVFMPFVMATYADTGKFGDAFNFGRLFGMVKSAIGPAVIVLLVSALAGMLAGLAGAILCGIGTFATMFYAQLINAFLYGTLYNKARQAVL